MQGRIVVAPNEDPRDMAALWIARARDPAFDDWAALTEWLEADPCHNDAYEAAFRAHDLAGVAAEAETAPASNDDETPRPAPRRRWRWAAGGGLAAAAAAGLALLSPIGSVEYVIVTPPGQQRSIDLADGSRIAMNGGTRLVLDRRAARKARLDHGEASFAIVHDPAHPFTVEAGGTELRDLGTRFNVVREGHGTEVAVAEGAVLFDPGGASVKLTPGRMLRASDSDNRIELADVDPGAVGSWQSGTLLFRDAPLSEVAAQLSRSIGEPVTVAAGIASQRFSGGIAVKGVERRQLFGQVAALLDVTATHDETGWHLSSRRRAAD
jgi:transmembrane sensor